MNKTVAEATGFIPTLRRRISGTPLHQEMQIIIAPPFTAIHAMSELLPTALCQPPHLFEWSLAAQNVSSEADGAYTGEVSARMLHDLGCRYILVGHSERRLHHGETGAVLFRKVKMAQMAGMIPVVCVGESREEHLAGRSWNVIERQLEEVGLNGAGTDGVMVAYEPVWAIGTGQIPHPDEIDARHVQIRHYISGENGPSCDRRPQILYGGSVNTDNVAELVRRPNVDGVLVGGASLSPDTFADLIITTMTTLREN
jgi:triosephosphate isomerase